MFHHSGAAQSRANKQMRSCLSLKCHHDQSVTFWAILFTISCSTKKHLESADLRRDQTARQTCVTHGTMFVLQPWWRPHAESFPASQCLYCYYGMGLIWRCYCAVIDKTTDLQLRLTWHEYNRFQVSPVIIGFNPNKTAINENVYLENIFA